MHIPDRTRAAHYLRHVSYYRLRAYWLPFEHLAPPKGDHKFKAGVSFEDVLSLYVFDRRLRVLVIDAIERIEVSLRGVWAHHMAMKYGPHGFLDPAHYVCLDFHAKNLASLQTEIGRSQDTFISHYKTKYKDPALPPIWMAAEVMSMGLLSKWIADLKLRADRKAISKPYGLDQIVLVSMAHNLAHVRNICAHHGRLWNKQFTVTMTVPNSPSALKLAMNPTQKRQLYNTLAAVGYMIGTIAPDSEWRQHLISLITSCSLAEPAAMGFPNNWLALPVWKVT
jgi:abortive infection bacteriophage resistance protein